MATGSLSGNVCYESLSLATDAYFSALPSSLVVDPVTGIATQTSFVSVFGVWYMKQALVSAAGVFTQTYTVPAVPPSFAACYSPLEAFSDGVNMGWSISVLLVVILFVYVCTMAIKNA